MTLRFFALLVALITASPLFPGRGVSAATPIDPNPFVQPQDFSGQLRGFSIGFKKYPDSYYSDIRTYGANLVRVFFPFKRCSNCDRYGRSPEDVALLDDILLAAERHQLKVVVVSGFQELETGEIWKRADLQDSVVNNWRWFAERYASNTTIAGFDLLNEPNMPWPHDWAENYVYWQPLVLRIVEAVRAVDQNHVVIVESAPGALAEGFKFLKPIKDKRVVYSLHFYAPHNITHQLVSKEWSRKIPYPAGIEYGLGEWDVIEGVGRWDKDRLSRTLEPVRQFVKKYNAIIYVGEFSCVRWAPDGSAPRYVSDVLELFNAENWSWTYHEFRGWPGWDAEISSDDLHNVRTSDAPTISIIKRALSPTAKNSMAR